MGNSGSSKKNSSANFYTNAKEPLVPKPFVVAPEATNANYDTFHVADTTGAGFIQHSSLLDPSGHLSQDLREVLDEIFKEYGSGLVMTKEELMRYVSKCYPGLHEEVYYEDRATYLLSKYGTPFANFKERLQLTLESKETQEKSEKAPTDSEEVSGASVSSQKYTIIEDRQKPNITRVVSNTKNEKKVGVDTTVDLKEEEKVDHRQRMVRSARKMRKYSLMTIEEDKEILEKTLQLEIDDEELILTKTQFFLLYRKACIDRPMMARLELVALGFNQFKSSFIVDRTKSLDVLAFKVHQMRNRRLIHFEEKQRISEARSAEECAQLINNYVSNQEDPLDKNDGNNIFRRRKPMKFGRFCWCFCPCFVVLYKCCCEY